VPLAAAVDDLKRLVAGHHDTPHAVLGPHPHGGGVTIRTLRPMARSVTIVSGAETVAMTHEHEGVWVGVLPTKEVGDYRLEIEYEAGGTHTYDDPYRFLPTVRELDQHLIGEGRHEQLWTVLGAHVHRYPGAVEPVVGTSFAVWAPNAKGVRVAGDFNFWDGRAHPMRKLGATGVWELFVPDIGKGTLYKYEVCGADGVWRQKADPLATHT